MDIDFLKAFTLLFYFHRRLDRRDFYRVSLLFILEGYLNRAEKSVDLFIGNNTTDFEVPVLQEIYKIAFIISIQVIGVGNLVFVPIKLNYLFGLAMCVNKFRLPLYPSSLK